MLHNPLTFDLQISNFLFYLKELQLRFFKYSAIWEDDSLDDFLELNSPLSDEGGYQCTN